MQKASIRFLVNLVYTVIECFDQHYCCTLFFG